MILLPVLQPPAPIEHRHVWDCCSFPSPCFDGCDGGRTVYAPVCTTCGRWSLGGADTIKHHRMCPVINWSLAEYGPDGVDADGRPEMGAPEVMEAIGGSHG